MSDSIRPWYRYWGKARPASHDGAPYHLLPYHCLDVAACGHALLRLPRFSVRPLADALGWDLEVVQQIFVYFLALHDVGKVAPNFQGLAPNLSTELVTTRRKPVAHQLRHDVLGWLLWRKVIVAADSDDHSLPDASSGFWQTWARVAMGHHGVPPDESTGHGLYIPQIDDHFWPEDLDTVRAYDHAMRSKFLPTEIPAPSKPQHETVREYSWMLAGVAVLADWLGSAERDFAYRSTVISVDEYWNDVAVPAAKAAVARAGFVDVKACLQLDVTELLPNGAQPSPLQRYAGEVPLQNGPQVFILEDVTGAGKTEAALILTQRLMAAGRGHGFYFALPTMATATQMYDRVGPVYRRMFDPEARPSLVLAHSARDLVDGFRESVIVSDGEGPTPSRNDQGLDAAAECAAWLADSRKKALLADAGVGTIDQALLAVLPVRHQSLRMLGLSGKVLIVDEVHAYDTYMLHLLKVLLEHHARSGGSAILLSATIPQNTKEELLAAFARGLGVTHDQEAVDDWRYPLATQAGAVTRLHSCQTREPLRRSVRVVMLHDEAEVVRLLADEVAKGRCVGWIRNTVEDARRGHRGLAARLPAEQMTLFHSRFALGDRLAIEKGVVNRLGAKSTGTDRCGQALVGTQVLEQSLDYDVDVMVSDWAPIDLIIQRAGRLMRHVRTIDGDPAPDGREGRGDPVLYVLVPPLIDPPMSDWYSALFPKAQYVYEDSGRLWLGADAQRRAGRIDTPGELRAPASVRALVAAVYGDDAAEIPEALQSASTRVEGDALAERGMGVFNALRLDAGYTATSSVRWTEDDRVPTRLGQETRTIYLALSTPDGLVPLKHGLQRPWENSSVRVDAKRFRGLGAAWQTRFGAAIAKLRSSVPLLREPAFVMPLVAGDDGVLRGTVSQMKGPELEITYNLVLGLEWEGVS